MITKKKTIVPNKKMKLSKNKMKVLIGINKSSYKTDTTRKGRGILILEGLFKPLRLPPVDTLHVGALFAQLTLHVGTLTAQLITLHIELPIYVGTEYCDHNVARHFNRVFKNYVPNPRGDKRGQKYFSPDQRMVLGILFKMMYN